ncbi:MAG: 2-oxo acid dehydrogenase subunit E2 [Maledivibacter sp.]|nr:2-oxo acid dehydrogenase subunit E2 [Maledivibacter sp.]
MAKIEIRIPKFNSEMEEGVVVKILKGCGENIEKDETIAELVVGKLNYEVTSPQKGRLKELFIREGEIVPVGFTIAELEIISNQSTVKADKEYSVKIMSDKQEIEKKVNESKRVKASPIAKKLAQENGIDIAEVVGTGPNGRITKNDVEKYIKAKGKVKSSPMAEKAAIKLNVKLSDINKDGRIMKQDILEFNKKRRILEAANPIDERVPMTQMRKVIAQRMSHSWRVSPAVTYDIKVDVTNLRGLKNKLKDIYKVTYTDLLVKILSRILLEFPLLNCSIDGEELIYRNYTNIGVAVAIYDGLVVPVVKYANTKGLKEISTEIKDLAFKAKNNELSTEDLTEGTFTITNLGMYGIDSFSPIINQPEVAILGVNTIVETPVLENGNVINKPFMKLSLTADHRAVDGAVAAQFLYKIKQYIDKPEMLIL